MIPDLTLGRRLAGLFPSEQQPQAADVERTIEDRINYPSQRFSIACTSTTRPTNPRAGDRIYETDTNREYVWNGSAWVTPGGVPTGSIVPFTAAAAPGGWLVCDGSSLLTASYPALFAVIGYTYGGAGVNFSLPNLKGRIPVGVDTGQTEFDTLGETGGAKTHTLTSTEMPSHSHSDGTLAAATGGSHNHGYVGISAFTGYGQNSPINGNAVVGVSYQLTSTDPGHTHDVTGSTGSVGSGGAHNNLQPYIALHWIIKT